MKMGKVNLVVAFAVLALVASLSTGAIAAQKDASVTYTKDVLPILQENCLICHRPNGSNLGGMVAPMAFSTYAETRPWAKAIARAVAKRDMPPWGADPKHAGTFIDERGLTEDEIATIVAWVESGARRGNPKDAPPAMEFPAVEGWAIGEPDLVITMPEPYFVPDDLLDATKYFPMKLTEEMLPEDRWLKVGECRPGSEAVHHIIISPFGGIAPGNRPREFRDGYGTKVRAGQDITWNMHYHKEPGPGTGMWDQSSVAVKFYPKDYEPEHVLMVTPLGPMGFKIPAGDPSYAASATHTFAKDSLLDSMMPHMHYRGTRTLYELFYPDGTEEVLLDVPQYDFNWQTNYRFIEPKAVPAGTKIKLTGWWDNSAENPFNPDPTIDVTWGEATHEEMLFGWLSYTHTDEDASGQRGLVRNTDD